MYYNLISSMNKVLPSNPLWNNLIAYYTGDNTSVDSKGTYNGTLINGATYGTGKINNGFSLDGVNDYVDIGDNLDIGLDSWSYNFWFKADTFSTYNSFITKANSGNNYPRWWIIQDNGKLSFTFQTDFTNTSRYYFNSSSSLTTGSFSMCTIIVNRLGAVRIFINSIEETVVSKDGNGTAITNDLTSSSIVNHNTVFPFVIGSFDAGSFPFDGIIDEVCIWKNKLLTATEVTELYNSGIGKQYPL